MENGQVGMNVGRMRRLQGLLTQGQLARILCIETQSVHHWEAGRAAPKVGRLPEIARILDCDIVDFFDETPVHRPARREECHADQAQTEKDAYA